VVEEENVVDQLALGKSVSVGVQLLVSNGSTEAVATALPDPLTSCVAENVRGRVALSVPSFVGERRML